MARGGTARRGKAAGRSLSDRDGESGGPQRFLRLSVPFFLFFVFFLVGLVVVPVPVIGGIRPPLLLMAVYYWAVYRPTLVPPWLCFALGLLADILGGLPLGMNALVLVLARWIAVDQRRFLTGQTFLAVWAVFGLINVGAGALQWGLFALARMQWPPVLPMAVSVLAGFLIYPLISLLLIAVHRLLPVAPRAIP